jgi:hydroxymethylbilane synthase
MSGASNFPAKLKIGTRGSELALWQARHVAARLAELGVATEEVVIQTRGDRDQATAFGAMGGKGLFTKEIEDALLAGVIDLAVHSLKDLPTELPAGLALAAVLERASPLDAWISPTGTRLEDLPLGARVASGSLRREAQLLALRPDLQIVPIRGNVPTRLRRVLDEGLAEGTLLAAAGLERLTLEGSITQVLPPEVLTPPMGQGALGIEARAGAWPELFAALEHAPSRLAADAERAFLAQVGGGCKTPVGILAEMALGSEEEGNGANWCLTAMLAAPQGHPIIRRKEAGIAGEELVRRARALGRALRGEAPAEILAVLRGGERAEE